MYETLDSAITAELLRRRGKNTIGQVAIRLAKETGITKCTASNFIGKLESGEVVSTSVHNYSAGPISKINLEKIAVYLRILKVEASNPIIKKLREYSRSFRYPISSSRKPRRQYAR